jgi:hypothetical protein
MRIMLSPHQEKKKKTRRPTHTHGQCILRGPIDIIDDDDGLRHHSSPANKMDRYLWLPFLIDKKTIDQKSELYSLLYISLKITQ